MKDLEPYSASRGGASHSNLPLPLTGGRRAATGDSSVMSADEITPVSCPYCREAMKLIHTLPHLEGLPEISVFYCARCKHAETQMQACAPSSDDLKVFGLGAAVEEQGSRNP
jgi:hypothetical protein